MDTKSLTYTTQITTRPWEVYQYLKELNLHVIVDGKKNRYDMNWRPNQLQNATYNLDFSECNVKEMVDILDDKGIDACLLITCEDTASWTNYTQQYQLREVINTKILQFKPKQRVSAHEGLIIRVRIVVNSLRKISEEPIQKYSLLDEKVFNLHVDIFASEFDVRLVDSVEGDSAYRVCRQNGSDALTQPIQECVYVEFDRNAYDKYLTASTTSVGKALSAIIVSDILSEIAFSCINDLDFDEEETISVDEDNSSMIMKLVRVFEYSDVNEFRKDLMKNPNVIRHRSRRLMKITSKLLSI